MAMLLWMSRRSLTPALRWLAVAAMPALLLALYFTYSRGGLLALLVAAGCLLALSHDRLWLLATLAIGALGALPAVLAVQARARPRRQPLDTAGRRRPGRDGAADPARRDRAGAGCCSPGCGGSSGAAAA